jgi:endonuclease-3
MDATPVIDRLERAHPDAACALTHEDPFQLLVATILSAQCTDARVNLVTPELFRRYPDAAAMSRATQADLEKLVRTTGFFRNKSKSIRGASERLIEAFGGTVPRTMDELLTLPGVARKTANVVLGVGHGLAEGIVVDTHVARVSRRLGLSRARNAVEIERELMQKVPRDKWILFSHLLIFHGRRVCTARKPECEACVVLELCPSGPYYLRGKVPPWDRRAAEPPSEPKRRGTARKPARRVAAKKSPKKGAARESGARKSARAPRS